MTTAQPDNFIIYTVEEYGGIIHFAGMYYSFSNTGLKLTIYYNDDLFYSATTVKPDNLPLNITNVDSTNKYWMDFYIPFLSAGFLKFYSLAPDGGVFPVLCRLALSSRLNDQLDGAFAIGEHCIITRARQGGANEFIIDKLDYEKLCLIANEYIDRHYKGDEYKDDLAIIDAYINMYDYFSKKKIWLFMDRRNKADESAEYLFEYCSGINDGVDKYFIINKDSLDAARISRYGQVIDYGSSQHKFLALFADKFICSFFEYLYEYPFDNAADTMKQHLYRGLVRSKFVYLQHGVFKDDLSAIFNRYVKNAKLIITSSLLEGAVLTSEKYGFSCDAIKNTGAPKYDGLYNDVKKKILFMPTWRRNMSENDSEYNIKFAVSDYCININGFLNNERLLAAAKKHGYEILFRPHPRTLVQLKDFKVSWPAAIVSRKIRNRQLYAEGALLVTDYSSAMFDFAYIKKPVVYYQFSEHNYETKYFDYGIMGFGEVENSLEGIVTRIIEYMESGCRIKTMFKDRIECFFSYNDFDNCKRSYNEIRKMKSLREGI